MMGTEEGFFSRWARRKAQARQSADLADVARPEPGLEAEAARQCPPAAPSPQPVSDGVVRQGPVPTEALTLADVQRLQPGQEIARFMARQVAPEVRRAALKKLFADPHFNVMDGLDVYIDDYSVPSPLAPQEVARLLGREGLLGRHSLGLGEPQPTPGDAVHAVTAQAASSDEPAPHASGPQPAAQASLPDAGGAWTPVEPSPALAVRSDGLQDALVLAEITAPASCPAGAAAADPPVAGAAGQAS